MYRAKERGRNQYQFFAEEMKVVALQRLTLETGLRLAIESRSLRRNRSPPSRSNCDRNREVMQVRSGAGESVGDV